jgi:Ca-activated chloride channel family protein
MKSLANSPWMLLALSLLPAPTGAYAPLPCSGRSPFEVVETQAISREVDLVVLPVNVTDHHGCQVEGLKKEDFQVYEDGHPQEITVFGHDDVPLTAGLVLDNSSSMAPGRYELITAATDFLHHSNREDQLFVVNFSDEARLGMPADMPFTSNVLTLKEAVFRGVPPGRTAMYDALALGLNHLAEGNRNKKALVLISDGGDNASRETFPQILDLAQKENAIIYTIGIVSESSTDVKPAVLRKLARATGGQAFFPSSIKEVPETCEKIAKELRQQYTLGYSPTNSARDGSFRTIRVTVHSPEHGDLVVRTRTGYFATGGRSDSSASSAASGLP